MTDQTSELALGGEFVSLPWDLVLYGSGTRNRLPEQVARVGASRVLIVTGRSLVTKTPVVPEIENVLGELLAGTYSGIRQHVPESDIADAVELAVELQVDALVSVGGGSPIDAAKAIARKMGSGKESYLPHLAVPTTLSAAEFSHLAGYTDKASGAKTGFADTRVTPGIVILDPWVTFYTPAILWTSSGIRALDHAVETLYSPGFHPLNDVLALEAIKGLFDYLPRSKERPDDLQARLHCQLAAWMSFFAPASVKMGLSHRLGRLTGARSGILHGVTSCIYLPLVMKAKAGREAGRLAPVAHKLGLVREGVPDHEAAAAAATAVANLIRELGLPSRLRDVGVTRQALGEIAREAKGDFPDEEMIDQILERAW